MILILKISNSDFSIYTNEFNECLKYNLSIFERIFIFSDFHLRDFSGHPKIRVFKSRTIQPTFNCINIAKSNAISNDIFIFSNPFVKWKDLSSLNNISKIECYHKPDCFYVFHRNLPLHQSNDLDSIFVNLKSFSVDIERIKSWPNTESHTNKEQIQVIRRKSVPSNKSILLNSSREKKLDVLIVSVNYNDFLLTSLPYNKKIFDNITVVTSTDDLMCQKICEKFRVNCLITDVMYDSDSKFNKGKAINYGLSQIENKDLILILDADIIVTEKIELNQLDDESLYTSGRWICETYHRFQNWEKSKDTNDLNKWENDRGFGFFQLFNSNNQILNGNFYPENFKDASMSDLVFRDKFTSRRSIENKIIHLGEAYTNWSGRKTARFLTDDDFSVIFNKKSTFTICSYYFNYRGDLRQKNNFIKFLEQWKDYYENMIVGIVDYGDIDFEIPCKTMTIKGDEENKIWSKEILINKIIETVDTDYFIWIDGDLIYENLDWLNNIDEVAKDNDFVQLFETINYLDETGNILESHKSIISTGSTNIDQLLGKGYKPGGSWLGKTSILKENKLFEKMYVGGGDTIFVYGLFHIDNGFTLQKVKEYNNNIGKEAQRWINSHKKTKVSFLDVCLDHLYHGNLQNRNYDNRYKKLKEFESEIDVTILILAHKPSEYLKKCILSAKNQKFNGNLEILLTSDSCSELSYVESEYNIRFTLAQKPVKNSSCSFNFNHGVKESKGKYIKILAYDDFLLEDTIQNLYDEIKSDKFSLIHANCYEVHENQVKTYIPEVKSIKIDDLLVKNHIHGGTIIFNKEDFLDTNGLNDNLIYAEEYDFYFKLLSRGKKIGYLDKFVYNYRRHSGQKGTLSLTNDEKLAKSKIVEKIRNNYRPKKIVCGIATIYDRKDSLKKTINSIIDQVDELFVYQNGYYKVFDFLIDTKIKIFSSIHTGIDMGDAGKFYNIENIKDSYYFSIDDDLIYPSNYVENTIEELKKLNNESVVSYHGKNYSKKATSYYKQISENYRCLGVMSFWTEYLKLKFKDFEYANMADVFLGIIIKNQNKKCKVLNHKEGWIKHDDINIDNSLFVVNKNNKKIDEVFNRRNLPKICIVTTMWQRHRLTDFVFSYYNKLKSELKNEINLTLIACGSEGEVSKKIAENNGFYYVEFSNFPLSKKHNEIFIKSKEFNPDGVILIGSDDFLSKETLLTYKNLLNDYEYIGFKDFYLLNEKSELRYWKGYENERVGEPIGGGRFYRKDFLEKINWQPWGKVEINKSLDHAFSKQIQNITLNSKVIECSDKNGIVFTIRSTTNITKMNNIGHLVDSKIVNDKICNFYELLKLQKEI
jgi:hypothetical protein